MKTIAQQLGVTEFPFEIKDGNGNLIYKEWEDKNGYWERREYDSKGKKIYYEDSEGVIIKYPAINLKQKHKLKFKI